MLVLLVFVAVLTPPIVRSSAPDPRRPPETLRRCFALAPSESSRLSVMAWMVPEEDAAIAERSEDDDDDEEPCGATRRAYEAYDSSLSPSRGTPAHDPAVPGRLLASCPLRC
jgi:hypothetical protein